MSHVVKLIASNLNAMHKAREAFIQAESSEKIRRALRHNVRSSSCAKFEMGDIVYFKRNDNNRWRGPGTVIGQEHEQTLTKYGGSYVRVHSCRVIHYDSQNNVRTDAGDNDGKLGTDNMDASGVKKIKLIKTNQRNKAEKIEVLIVL